MTAPEQTVMNTVSGQEFRPFDPDPADVRIGDVSHALANTCRCSGQTRRFYSVALHSVYVSRELEAQDETPRVQLYGLLHDAAEAYLSDVVAPVKNHLTDYPDVEERVLAAVWAAADLGSPGDEEWDRVMAADRRLREYELDALLPEVVDGDPPDLSYDLTADDDADVAALYRERAAALAERAGARVP